MKGREGVRNLRAQIFLLFYALLRHENVLCLCSVAYFLPRRNKSMKKLRYFLARAENRRTFASDLRFMH